jgi:hypothetical protein
MERPIETPCQVAGLLFYPDLTGQTGILSGTGIIFAIIKKRKKDRIDL